MPILEMVYYYMTKEQMRERDRMADELEIKVRSFCDSHIPDDWKVTQCLLGCVDSTVLIMPRSPKDRSTRKQYYADRLLEAPVWHERLKAEFYGSAKVFRDGTSIYLVP